MLISKPSLLVSVSVRSSSGTAEPSRILACRRFHQAINTLASSFYVTKIQIQHTLIFFEMEPSSSRNSRAAVAIAIVTVGKS